MDTSDEGSMAPSAAAAAGRAKNTADKLASGADTTPVDEAEGSDVEGKTLDACTCADEEAGVEPEKTHTLSIPAVISFGLARRSRFEER